MDAFPGLEPGKPVQARVNCGGTSRQPLPEGVLSGDSAFFRSLFLLWPLLFGALFHFPCLRLSSIGSAVCGWFLQGSAHRWIQAIASRAGVPPDIFIGHGAVVRPRHFGHMLLAMRVRMGFHDVFRVLGGFHFGFARGHDSSFFSLGWHDL